MSGRRGRRIRINQDEDGPGGSWWDRKVIIPLQVYDQAGKTKFKFEELAQIMSGFVSQRARNDHWRSWACACLSAGGYSGLVAAGKRAIIMTP